jgi:DNA-binding transcriptional regulator YhcF (GntR family)
MTSDKNSQENKNVENERKNAVHCQFEANQAVIAEAFIKIVSEKQRRPTYREVADFTGFHYNTVRTHLKTLEETKFKDRFRAFRALTDHVILAQAKAAMSPGPGSAASAKLFLEIVEGIRPGMKIDINSNINISNMSTEELLKRQGEHSKLLNSKLLRFTRDNQNPGRTGSD